MKEALSGMLAWIVKLLGSTDEVSSMRLIMLTVVFAVLIVWVVMCIGTKTVQDIPAGVIAFVSIAIAGKTVQKFREPKEPGGP